MLRKSFILVLVLVVLISTGVFVAAAQTGDPAPTPFAPGWMHHGGEANFSHGMMGGRGMMGHGSGGMMGNDDQSMLTVVAEVLGLEPATLIEALQSGQTLVEIAETQGVELQTVHDAVIATAEAHMAQMVAAGHLTQEQADEHLTWMRDNIAAMPMFSNMGLGCCMQDGMPGMRSGHGMMGHGRGMGNS